MTVDLATAWVTLAVWGHLTDRLLFGAARDWLVTPIGVANLPDMAVWPALLLCGVELWRYPPARRLLHPDPRRWRPPTPTAIRRLAPGARCAGVPGWTRPAARAPTVAGPTKRLLVTSPTPALRRNNRIAAVLMLVAASMAGVAATGTRPVVFVALVLVFTVAALSFALRGRFDAR